jgi:D-alanine-D-alanine ligase
VSLIGGPLHVAVLMGGWSAEREVSLVTGAGVADALESKGHRVTRIDLGRDVAARLAEAKPDVVFNALHGTPGEDGSIQGLMDIMGLKYTHSGLATSVIAIDKELTKMVLVPHGIRMPAGEIVESAHLHERDPMAARPSAWRSSRATAIMAIRSAATWKGRGSISIGCSPSRSSRGGS